VVYNNCFNITKYLKQNTIIEKKNTTCIIAKLFLSPNYEELSVTLKMLSAFSIN
jgi:hypothetical protein